MWETYQDISIVSKTSVPGEVLFYAQGGHIKEQIVLGDVLELESSQRFKLIGRHADMINIAGKRSSLAYLNHLLNSIDGVIDGVFYLPESVEQKFKSEVQRLSAFVVAPTLNEAEILAFLRKHIDPLFMPRPVYFLPRLPRNETGKLPQQTLAELAKQFNAQSNA
jgi:acyl-coenzyme A synthetase/AMP-(fatty) acid ligase